MLSDLLEKGTVEILREKYLRTNRGKLPSDTSVDLDRSRLGYLGYVRNIKNKFFVCY